MTESIQRVQIERIVTRNGSNPYGWVEAVFRIVGGQFCCRAGYSPTDAPWIEASARTMSIEEAGQVHIALQMAIDWLVEESAALISGAGLDSQAAGGTPLPPAGMGGLKRREWRVNDGIYRTKAEGLVSPLRNHLGIA